MTMKKKEKQETPKFKEGDYVATRDGKVGIITKNGLWCFNKDQYFYPFDKYACDAQIEGMDHYLKEDGKYFNKETFTIEDIVPKFKVGDKIRIKKGSIEKSAPWCLNRVGNIFIIKSLSEGYAKIIESLDLEGLNGFKEINISTEDIELFDFQKELEKEKMRETEQERQNKLTKIIEWFERKEESKSTPTESKNKFKVGDKVRFTIESKLNKIHNSDILNKEFIITDMKSYINSDGDPSVPFLSLREIGQDEIYLGNPKNFELVESEDIIVDYGDKRERFENIAQLASALTGKTLTPADCCKVMMAVKLSREAYRHKRDNLIDLCGYAEILNILEDAGE